MTEHIKTDTESHNPYMERSGIGARQAFERLMLPPGFQLSDQDLLAAKSFDHSLANHELTAGKTIADLIRGRKEEATIAPFLYIKPFMTTKNYKGRSKSCALSA
jgi:hypothetical protein